MEKCMKKKNINSVSIQSEQKTRLLLLAALFVSCLLIFRKYIFGDRFYVFNDIGSDTWQLYTMQFTSIVNRLRAGNFALWDFTNGFGVNQFNLNLFDPSLMLLYGLGYLLGPQKLLSYLVWTEILKILLAGWVFYWYLSCFSFGKQAKYVSAYAYGLSGYLLVWGQHYQFGMVTIYFPLMLFFCEKFLAGKRSRGWFPAAVFLSAIYSSYFTYMSLAGLGLYLLVRVCMEDDWTWKKRWAKFFGGCGCILLGLGMGMVVFLPMASALMNVSSRIGAGNSGIVSWLKESFSPYSFAYYKSLLMRFFSSNLQTTYNIVPGAWNFAWNYYEDPVLFCSGTAVLLDAQFLAVFYKARVSKRKKAAVYTTAGLMAVCLLLPLGGSIFNGFNVPSSRYTFVLIPFMLLAMAWTWDYMEKERKVNLFFFGAVCVVMLLVYYKGMRQSIFTTYKRNAVILAGAGVMTAFCLCIQRFGKSMRMRRYAMYGAVMFLSLQMISEGNTCVEERYCLLKKDTPTEEVRQAEAAYEEEQNSGDALRVVYSLKKKPQDYFRELYSEDIQEALTYLKEKDPEFFRVEKDFTSATTSMDALAQGYYGVSSYNSTQNKNIQEFADYVYPQMYSVDINHYNFTGNTQDNEMAAFLGIRYLLSRNGELDPDKYRRIGQFGNIYLYENVIPSDMARFYENAISEDSLKMLGSGENRMELLKKAIAVEDGRKIQSMEELENMGDIQENSKVILDAPEKDSEITGRIQAAGDGYVLFMIPYEDGWSLIVDGKETTLLRGNLGFAACQVEKGNHEIVLSFRAPGLRMGAVLSIVFWCIYLLLYFPGVIPLYFLKVRMK